MSIELLPPSVIARRTRRILVRRWASAVVVAAGLAGAAIALTQAAVHAPAGFGPRSAAADDGPLAPDHVAGLRVEGERLLREQALADETLRREMARLSANRALADSVDWSDLLAAVAGAAGDGVMLSRVALGPASAVRGPAAAMTAPTADGGLAVDLEGFGRTPGDVARFVLELETMAIFDQVTLLETRGQVAGGGAVSGYRVRCLVRGPAGAGA